MREHVTLYSRQGAFLGVLENAGDVGYLLRHNDLWTATFTLPQKDPANALCQPFCRVRLTDGERDTGLYRIIAAPEGDVTAEGGLITYQLEHVMATLLDELAFGTHTVTGFAAALRYILSLQQEPLWQLGTCDFDDQAEHSFEDVPLLTAMTELAEGLGEEYTWDFDTSGAQWTVHLRRADDTPGCGIYYGRNMQGIRRTIDATATVTRLYPLGRGEDDERLTITAVNDGVPYIDADTAAVWGVKSRVWTDLRITDG